MRIALVHELLTMRGGAERLLRVLAAMFPDAPIYTLLYNEAKLGEWFPRGRVRTSTIQKMAHSLPLTAYRFNHHLSLRRFPSAVEAWDFSTFDLVISTSSAFVHGIITNGRPRHLCYVHSPARYLWDRTHDVLDRAGSGMLGMLRKTYLSRAFHELRIWDSEAAERPDMLLAASKEVQRRIELYWRRPSDVVHPPIDDFWLHARNEQRGTPLRPALCAKGIGYAGQARNEQQYYFIASTLVPYKHIDLAIETCNRRKTPLKIAGEGPDRARLEKLAGPMVKFLGYQTEEQLRHLYANATATLFPGLEDFGLVPLESLACGTPVIAFGGGGALETLIEGKTGAFFDSPTAESLMHAMERFGAQSYDVHFLQEHARQFSRERFEGEIRKHIGLLMEQT